MALPLRRLSSVYPIPLSAARIRHRSTSSNSSLRLVLPSLHTTSRFSVFRNRVSRFSSHTNNSKLSRKERRLIERKERNRSKRESKKFSNNDAKESTTDGIQKALSDFSVENLLHRFEFLIPRLPGRNVSFTHSSLWMALGIRFPLFVAISYLITNEKTTPYVIQGSLGPSMLPTIQFVGDIWLVETHAWAKGWRWMKEKMFGESEAPEISSLYQVGDLVIWEDTTTGKRSCKRIVGLEGDTVHRFGEYRKLYREREDAGVLWPRKGRGEDHTFGAFSRPDSEKDQLEGKIEEPSDKLVVPKQCVWLEGDCPLFSMDSRQYGPIHSSRIRGKLVFRLWPWNRDDLVNDEENSYLSSCSVSKQRPIPYLSTNAYIGKRFGLYRVESSSNEN